MTVTAKFTLPKVSVENFNKNALRFKNILDNSKSLVEDAEILLNAGKTRGAAALAIVSYEELVKYFIICEDPNDKRAFYHVHKFAPITNGITEVVDYLEKIVRQALESSLPTEVHAKYIQFFDEELFGSLRKNFNLQTARHKLLNEDPTPQEPDYTALAEKHAVDFIPVVRILVDLIFKALEQLPLSPGSNFLPAKDD